MVPARLAALLIAAAFAMSCAARPAPAPVQRPAPPPAARPPRPPVAPPPPAPAPPPPAKRPPPAPLPAAPPAAQPPRLAPARDAQRVGLLFPSQGQYRGFGIEARRGAELCLEDAGAARGLRLAPVFVEEAEGASGAALLAAFDEPGGAPIVAIIGPLLSGTAERLLPVAAARSLPVISPTAASARLGEASPVFFRTCMTMESFADGIAAFAVKRLGRPSFAVLAPAQPYGRAFAAAFGRALEERGGSVQLVREYEPGLRNLVPWAAGLRDDLRAPAAKEPGAWSVDALFLAGAAQDAGMILPRLAYLGLDPRSVAVVGGSALNAAPFPRLAGGYAEGALVADAFFAASELPEARVFTSRYRERHGADPGAAAAQGCAAAQALAAALAAGAGTPREALAALEALGEVSTAVGPIVLAPGGRTARQPFFMTVRGSALVELR